MRVALASGTGHIGSLLAKFFLDAGHSVTILSRHPQGDQVAWDAQSLGPWTSTFEGLDVVVNLAGKSVNCRYTEENLREMMSSRVDSTRVIGEAISMAKSPPRVWLQASTATIYSHRFDAPNDEITGTLGGSEPGIRPIWKRSIEIAKAWEAELESAPTQKTRKVAMRMAIVMTPVKDSAFGLLAGVAKCGLLGKQGSGKQMVSWIHDLDLARAVSFLIENESLSGPVNLAAPNPLPQAEFATILRRALGVRVGLPAPAPLLDIVAWLKGSHSELLLKSRYVVPTRLLRSGFEFRFPDWPSVAADLVARL